MNEMRTDEHRIELERKAEELRRTLQRRGQIAVERAPDDLDETLFAAERESATKDLERTYQILRQVELALSREQSGTYGICIRCEEPIAEKRLKAIPWAVYCLDCQETVDHWRAQMRDFRKPAA